MPGRTLTRNDSQLITGATFSERLKGTLDAILSQVQDNIQNHQKNQVALYKLHFQAQSIPEVLEAGPRGVSGERLFRDVFDMRLSAILDIPRKPQFNKVDRVVQFIGSYVKYMNEKVVEDIPPREDEDEDDETFASRFTAHFIRYILRGYMASNKTVRLRVVQLTSVVVSHLGQIDIDLYNDLKKALQLRAVDKETSVRTFAAICLCKIIDTATEDAEYDEDIEQLLLERLCCDPAAEVRRTILAHIPVTESRLASILARLRDTDAATRRVIYIRTLALEGSADEGMSAVHPHALKRDQIERIAKFGLNDRDESVRAAAARLVATWYDEMGISVKAENGDKSVNGVVEEQMVAFLSLFDLQVGGGELAQQATEAVFQARSESYANLKFDSMTFWEQLTPESALLARIFVEYCRTHDSGRIDIDMPEVQVLSTVAQNVYNAYLEDIDNQASDVFLNEDQQRRIDAAIYNKLLILDQVLRTITLMPMDHFGGIKTAQLMSGLLQAPPLPQELIPRCLDVLREVCQDERDLIMRIVEIVDELRDPAAERVADELLGEAQETQDDERSPEATPRPKPDWNDMFKKPAAELTAAERQRVDEIDMKCLTLLECVLERVEEPLENNAMLIGPTTNIILPAVDRQELKFKEKGLTCLGLLCTISLPIAQESMRRLLGHLRSDECPMKLRVKLAMIVFDILLSHRHWYMTKDKDNLVSSVFRFGRSYRGSRAISFGVGASAVWGDILVYLVLTDVQAIRNLIITYTDPANKDNQALIQCLHHALGVFAHTSAMNKDIMRSSFRPVYKELVETYHEQEDALEPSRVVQLFLEWTDPDRASWVVPVQEKMTVKEWSVQLDLARDVLRMLLKDEFSKDERKPLCTMLSGIRLPDGPDVDALKVQKVKVLTETLLKGRHPPPGKQWRDQVEKFDRALEQKYASQLEGFSREEAREREEFKALFDFVDDMLGSDGEEEEDVKPATRRSSRCICAYSGVMSGGKVLMREADVRRVWRRRGRV
ncbi:nuclear condensing complex subunit [Schizophyllum fasciatum]